MTDEEQYPYDPSLLPTAPSPITGIGFRPTKVSKAGFVLEIESYTEGEG